MQQIDFAINNVVSVDTIIRNFIREKIARRVR